MRFLGSLISVCQRFGPLGLHETEYYQWMRWHWDRSETTLEGRFRTPYCAPKGRLERHPDGTFTMYIYDPPEALLHETSKYRLCFRPTPSKKGEYSVHYDGSQRDFTIDGHIQWVERAIVETLQQRS